MPGRRYVGAFWGTIISCFLIWILLTYMCSMTFSNYLFTLASPGQMGLEPREMKSVGEYLSLATRAWSTFLLTITVFSGVLSRWDSPILQARTLLLSDLPKVLCPHGTQHCFHFSMLPVWLGTIGFSGPLLAPWLQNITFAFENLNFETNLRKYSALTIILIYRVLYLFIIF